jgi:hypothetical protein
MASFVVEQRLQKFFGKSGIVYLVNYNPETHWSPFYESANGWVSVKDENGARDAAIDCGAVGSPTEHPTHYFWNQLMPKTKV